MTTQVGRYFARRVGLLRFERWGRSTHCSYFYEIHTREFSSKAGMSQLTEDSITKKLTDELKPSYLNVINESFMHNVPKGSETHFKVVVVSEKFDNLPLIQRHRMVNQILEKEMQASVHALSIQAKTPQQWESSEGKISKSPPCLGGAGK